MFRVRRQASKQAAPGARTEAKPAEQVSPASTAATSPKSSTESLRKVRFFDEALGEGAPPSPTAVVSSEEAPGGCASPASTPASSPKSLTQPSRMFRVRRKASKEALGSESPPPTEASSPWSSLSEDLQESPAPEREGQFVKTFSTARRAVDALPRKAMVRILQDLLALYSSESFQARLQEIAPFDDQDENAKKKAIPGEEIAELLRTTHRGVLSEHRLPQGEEGEIALVYLTSLFNTWNDVEGKRLVDKIDDKLFGPSPYGPIKGRRLWKHEVVDAVRSQIMVFASETFQSKLASLKKEEEVKSGDSQEPAKTHADGLPMSVFVHALRKQMPILDRYGLPCDERGLRQLFFNVAAFVGDPTVARGVSIANALLGMDEAAIVSFGDRLRRL